MNTLSSQTLSQAIQCIKNGGVIAYPTESVYGLGCDPLNHQAVSKLLEMKQRNIGKGLILVASHIEQVERFIIPPPPINLTRALSTWPGPYTWIFRSHHDTPTWITGDYHHSIAIRISAHPVIRALCDSYGKPIISTSANISGEIPARSDLMVQRTFGEKVDFIVPGKVGTLTKPTTIRDVMTGETLRA